MSGSEMGLAAMVQGETMKYGDGSGNTNTVYYDKKSIKNPPASSGSGKRKRKLAGAKRCGSVAVSMKG